jgi:hypothetical protein
MEGTVRKRRARGAQGDGRGREDGAGDVNLHWFSVQQPNGIELSPARESQRARLRSWAVVMGCCGGEWGKNGEERGRAAL